MSAGLRPWVRRPWTRPLLQKLRWVSGSLSSRFSDGRDSGRMRVASTHRESPCAAPRRSRWLGRRRFLRRTGSAGFSRRGGAARACGSRSASLVESGVRDGSPIANGRGRARAAEPAAQRRPRRGTADVAVWSGAGPHTGALPQGGSRSHLVDWFTGKALPSECHPTDRRRLHCRHA